MAFFNFHTIFIGIVADVAVILFVIYVYNKLVRLRNTANASWSDVDVFLKKRYDLIPKIVDAVRAYATHEKNVLESVTKLRTASMQATSPAEKSTAELAFSVSMQGLFMLVENYPELKANGHFRDLQAQLSGIEDGIESSRRYYNAVVRDYNTAMAVFPVNIVSAALRFSEREYFRLDDEKAERASASIRIGKL